MTSVVTMGKLLILLLFAISVSGRPSSPSSYQYVKFIGKTPNGKPSGTSYYISEEKKSGTRTARSFYFPYELYYGQLSDIWANELFFPQTHAFQQTQETHFTPDFSDGLSYPDPLLLRGPAAKLAVQYLYSKGLFFEDIPHEKVVYENQKQRQANGLPGNKLGSLRPDSPFSRYKHASRFYRY